MSNPEYRDKALMEDRAIFGDVQAVPYIPRATGQCPLHVPTNPDILTPLERRDQPIYLSTAASPYLPEETSEPTMPETNPEIVESQQMRQRIWYPEPYEPYVGYPRMSLEKGVMV